MVRVEEGVELRHELQKLRDDRHLSLLEEAPGVLPLQSVQRDLFGR